MFFRRLVNTDPDRLASTDSVLSVSKVKAVTIGAAVNQAELNSTSQTAIACFVNSFGALQILNKSCSMHLLSCPS